MIGIINLLYLILFLGLTTVGMYICYHILRYSLSKGAAFASVFVFATVFLFFLATNAITFFRIDWTALLKSSGSFSSFPSTYSSF
jgi:hypothetical protein